MTERERLVNLLQTDNCPSPFICDANCKYINSENCLAERIADYLLENGLTLNRTWISVDKALPTADGCFEVTIKASKGKRYVAFSNYNKNATYNKWDCGKDVIAWRERDKPYMGNSEKKILEWCDVCQKCRYYSEVITEYCQIGHDSVEHYCKKSGEPCQIIPRVHCKRCINEGEFDMEGYSND